MKHNRNVLVLASMFIVFAISVSWAEDFPASGFNTEAYELAFSEADRASGASEWLESARSGVAFMVARWERTAVYLYDDPELFASARRGVEEWTTVDTGKRFSVWLRDRFFGREAAHLHAIVSEQVGESNRQYLYNTDADGFIIYDAVGNPEYRASSDDISFDTENTAWHASVDTAVRQATASYSLKLESLRPELLAYIPEKDRALYDGLIREAALASAGRAERELDNLARREESLFVARRTVDIWSLRNRSEHETAKAIAEELVRQTGASCDEALLSLNARIEEAAAGTGDLALAGADWLKAFSEQFDRGLAAWKDAEERFMVKRLEWDRDAARSFDEGNEAWSEAFRKFSVERTAWEARATAQFRSGEEAFSRADEALADSIRTARLEYDRDAAERTIAGSERANAWVDVYLQAGSAAASALAGAGYWLSMLDRETPELDASELRGWVENELAFSAVGSGEHEILSHLADSLDMHGEYSDKAAEARSSLLDDFGLAMGSDGSFLHDVLEAGASSEDFNLDEYQVELIHASAVEGYWKQRVEVAQAVLDYASDLSAGRATESDSLHRLEDARLAYNVALLAYESAQASLIDVGAGIGESRAAMDTARAALAEIGERLETAASEYSILVSLLATGDASFIKEEILDRYRELLFQSGLSDIDGSPSEAGLVAAYLGKARELGYAEDLERSGSALEAAVEGRGAESSLAALSYAWNAILVPADSGLAPLDASLYGIAEEDTFYLTLQLVFDEMHSRLDAAVTMAEKDALVSAYRILAVNTARSAKSSAAAALEARLDGIALLGSLSAQDWYAGRTGKSPPAATIETALKADLGAASKALLQARAGLELAALDAVLGLVPPGDIPVEAAAIAVWWDGDLTAAEAYRASLMVLMASIESNSGLDDASFAMAMETVAGNDPSVAYFLRGRGYFSAAGTDPAIACLIAETFLVERARGRLESWNRYSPESPALESDRLELSRTTLNQAFEKLGVPMGTSGDLPGIDTVGRALFADGLDSEAALASLGLAVDSASGYAPSWMQRELSLWEESLITWIAARNEYFGGVAPASSLTRQAELSGASDRAMVLAGLLSGLTDDTSQATRSLCTALTALDWTVSEHSIIADELARRISLSLLANAAAPLAEPGWSGVAAALSADALDTYGYVPVIVRDAAVSLAMDELRIEDALAYERDPGMLEGKALEARLDLLWSELDVSAAAQMAAEAANPVASIAWSMDALVYGRLEGLPDVASRDDVIALSLPGADGEASWLDTYYANEGEDSGAVMQSLLELLAGPADLPWSLPDARNVVEEYAAASLSGAIAYRDHLRSKMGSASVLAERLMAVTLAGVSVDAGFLSWALGILQLDGADGVDAFISNPVLDGVEEAFLGLSANDSYAAYAAERYLVSLALMGDRAAFEAAGLRASTDAKVPGTALLGIFEAANTYAGEYSGDTLAWAARATAGDMRTALDVVRYLETGNIDNTGQGKGDPFNRWIMSAIALASLAETETARNSMILLKYSTACESARDQAGAGLEHWRQLLPDAAFLLDDAPDSGTGTLPAPLAAGNPEGGQGSSPRTAASWAEGALADAYEEAARRSAIVDASFDAWAELIAARDGTEMQFSAFSSIVDSFLADPETVFDDSLMVIVPSMLSSAYQEAYDEYSSMGSIRREAGQTLSRLAAAYAIASDTTALTDRISELEVQMATDHLAHDAAMADYNHAGTLFETAGQQYDAAYSRAKVLYEAEESARYALEKADAISRWASTAYLDSGIGTASQDDSSDYRTPSSELSYAQDSLARASTALAALSSLYDANAIARPYENTEYAGAYEVYRENYRRMLLVDDARTLLQGELEKEYRKNDRLFEDYQASYQTFEIGLPSRDFLPYLRIDADGLIRLAHGSDFVFAGASGEQDLEAYFNGQSADAPGGRHQSTAFRTSLDDLTAWITSSNFGETSARRWGLARDYVIGRLSAGDARFGELAGIDGTFIDDGLLGGHRFLPLGATLSEILTEYRSGELLVAQKAAYESLGAEERSWFETYLALELSKAIREPVATPESANGDFNAFSYWSKRMEYEKLEREAAKNIQDSVANQKISAAAYAGFLVSAALAGASLILSFLVPWFMAAAGVAYTAMIGFGLTVGDIHSTQAQYSQDMHELARQTSANVPFMTAGMTEHLRARNEYIASGERLDILEGKSTDGVAWDVSLLKSSLSLVGGVAEDEIERISRYFEMYQAETGASHDSASSALAAMASWSSSARFDSRNALERVHDDAETERHTMQDSFHTMLDSYIAGTTDEEALDGAILAAFGPGAASGKLHLENLATLDNELLSGTNVNPGSPQSVHAARDYALLVTKAHQARYAAERAVRESQWAISRKDLAEKRAAWRDAATLVLQRGRTDFDKGVETMRDRYASWSRQFADEYNNKTIAWNLAYAGMNDDRSAWALRAAQAATEASTGAMLALVGNDALASARRFDTLHISDMINEDVAIDSYNEVIGMAGIVGMEAGLRSHARSSETSARVVRTGIGGISAWDSGRIAVAAADFAESTSRYLAGAESLMVASSARDAASTALNMLRDNVENANQGFNKSMNTMFVNGGAWKRQGENFVKDVVVHSTVGNPYITEHASVKAYAWYRMADFLLQTDLSDATLGRLDPLSIQTLVGQAQDEVERASDGIFGSTNDNGAEETLARTHRVDVYRQERVVVDTRLVTWIGDDGKERSKTVDVYGTVDVLDHTEEQVLGAGEFGRHIGYAPVSALGANPDDGEDALFQSAGSGELGRLLAKFIYWSLKEGKGWSEANKAVYEKDLWDDRGDWFKAPTIRGVADIGITVAAGLLSGGTALPAMLAASAVNLVDDAVFGALDIAGGYRAWEEAGLDFGKKAAMSAANLIGGNLFGDAMARAESLLGMDAVIGKSVLGGLRTAATGIASNAIQATSWTGDRLAWSNASFAEGFTGSLASTVAGSAGSLTGGMLDLGLEGFTGDIFTNGRALSGFAGALLEQGTGYALSGQASFNLVNLDFLGIQGRNGNLLSTGLLQLDLGSDGISMGLGTGGMNTGFAALSAAVSGLEAWGVNARMATSGQEEGRRYASALRTLYSSGGGAGKERDLFENLLSGRTNIAVSPVGEYLAKTTRNSADGTRTILLGQGALLDDSRFGFNILLSHEAYRNGVDNGEAGQKHETRQAVLGHVMAANAIATTYGSDSLDDQILGELRNLEAAYYGDTSGLEAVMSAYDSSQDFWKLNKDGSLTFDALASLSDENGTIIRSAASMGLKETQIEGALIKILGLEATDANGVEGIRNLMVDAGMQHSYGNDSDQWLWRGTQSVALGADGTFPMMAKTDLSVANIGKGITLQAISELYSSMGAGSSIVGGFIDNTYGSALGMLAYAGHAAREPANTLLSEVYSDTEIKMIYTNQNWYSEAIRSGISTDAMVSGNARQTTGFGVETGDLALATSTVSGAAYFSEQHTGIDYGRGGTSISTPGGYWQFSYQKDHKAFFQLFGGDMKMRIMHLDPNEIAQFEKKDIVGNLDSPAELFKYPTTSFGSGTGAHIHIDFTRRLPYGGAFERQFVDPATLQPGSRFDYSYSYKDSLLVPLEDYPMNFYRY